jgi:O-antigen/teichoic acid export membrane protein
VGTQLQLKKFGKDALIYGFGGIVAKSISFFLLPIYTRIFSPAEYGTIEMLVVISGLLSALLTMGMDSAQSYFFFKQQKLGKTEQAKIVTAVLQWKLVWGAFVVILATLFSPLLNTWFFNSVLNWHYFAIAFAGALFAQVMQQSAEVFRLLYRPWPYVILIFLQSLVSALLIIILVLFFRQSVFGYLLGTTIASLVVAIVGWVALRDYIVLNIKFSYQWPKLLRFGAPLVPAGIAMYAMTTTDRWFLQFYHGQEVLGYYAVGAKLAMLFGFAIETFRKAWWPIAMESIHNPDGPETFRTIARLFMGFGVASIVYLTFLSPWVMRLMAAEIYYSAYKVVGVLAWSLLFYGFYMIAVAGLWKSEKTKYVPLCTGVAAVLNIPLNYLLVPTYGVIGAALATSAVYLIWVVIVLVISEKLWYVGYPFFLFFLQTLIGVVGVGWILYAHEQQYPVLLIAITSHIICFILLLSSFRVDQVQMIMRKLVKI